MLLMLLLSCLGLSNFSDSNLEIKEIDNVDTCITESAQGLEDDQEDQAALIEETFDNFNIPKKIGAAAIVNALAESNLKPELVGDNGNSVGLFQLNSLGLGKGLSVDQRSNPNLNVTIVAIQVLKNNKLLRLEKSGLEIPELTSVFTQEIMRPSNIELRKLERKNYL